MGQLGIEHPELLNEWNYDKNGDLCPEDLTSGSGKKVWWVCSKGHEWQTAVYNRTKGSGCPICSGKKILAGFNDLATTNPDLARQWHPTKNGDLTPHVVSAGTHRKVWWRCKQGHEWQAAISDRSNGNGCPICSGNQVSVGFNDLATTNPNLAKQWHPSKNGNLRPQNVSAGTNKKVWWICDQGHEWQDTVNHRSSGRGCPYCSGRRVLAGFNDLATVHPELVAQWHPTKNGDLTPKDVSPGSNKKVWWVCDKGHEWELSVSKRSSSRNGCPYCSGHRVWPGFNDLATTNPDLAAQWHPTKNEDLTPHNVTAGSSKKVWWRCSRGHEWQAVISSRCVGASCPICSGKKALAGFNDLSTTNPDFAKQWHPTKNGDLTPRDVKARSGKKFGGCAAKGMSGKPI